MAARPHTPQPAPQCPRPGAVAEALGVLDAILIAIFCALVLVHWATPCTPAGALC